jgi:hypothetical protein
MKEVNQIEKNLTVLCNLTCCLECAKINADVIGINQTHHDSAPFYNLRVFNFDANLTAMYGLQSTKLLFHK